MTTTYDSATVDSAGAFLIGQLERFDATLHMPLQGFTWSRDMPVRTDATLGDEFTSYLTQAYAAGGGVETSGKSWISKKSSTLPTVSVDNQKTVTNLYAWGQSVQYSIFELTQSQRLGQDIDGQQVDVLQKKFQQDIDIQVYLGDTVLALTGLLNNPGVATNVAAATGSGSSTLFAAKTPLQMLTDFNAIGAAAWAASGYTVFPNKYLIPPTIYGVLTQLMGTAGGPSVLSYIRENSQAFQVNGTQPEIVPCKWCVGTNNGNVLGANATDMIVAYTQDYQYLRFPMVPLQGMPMQYDGIHQKRAYVSKLGSVEFVRNETIAYLTGVG